MKFTAHSSHSPLATLLLVLLLALAPVAAVAKGVYLSTEEFLAKSFNQQKPALKTLWLNNDQKAIATDIMHRSVRALRVRYWAQGNRTAWIMEEIGKELPITIGIVVEDNHIASVDILTYRESRGGEVRFKAFRRQFVNGKLDAKNQLDSKIDGITGATLSVRAVTRTANLALYYHQLATTPVGDNY